MAGRWLGALSAAIAASAHSRPQVTCRATSGRSVFAADKKGRRMRAVIVGAGPTGLYTAIALARRGHQVMVVDCDRGPDGGRWWDRKGVMQFHHPHFFRQ